MDKGLLSSAQLETVTYACQAHNQLLYSKERKGNKVEYFIRLKTYEIFHRIFPRWWRWSR